MSMSPSAPFRTCRAWQGLEEQHDGGHVGQAVEVLGVGAVAADVGVLAVDDHRRGLTVEVDLDLAEEVLEVDLAGAVVVAEALEGDQDLGGALAEGGLGGSEDDALGLGLGVVAAAGDHPRDHQGPRQGEC